MNERLSNAISQQNVKYVVRKVKTAEAAATAEQHFYGCTCYNVSKGLTQMPFRCGDGSVGGPGGNHRVCMPFHVDDSKIKLRCPMATVATVEAATASNMEKTPTLPEFAVISILQLN